MEDNMATQYGKNALQALKAFRSTKWFTKDFISLASDIAAKYASRNEVLFGCLASDGGGATSGNDLDVSLAAGEVMLAGKMHPLGALANQNLSNVANHLILSSGADGSGVTLTGDAGNYVALIAINSNVSGGVIAEGTAPLIMGVLNGTDASTAAAATQVLNSSEITAALAASSGVHDGHTGWAWIAQLEFNVTANTVTVTSNINNHLGL